MELALSRLGPPKGSRKARKRVGRGESSGHGKTSSRGGKGQTARSGGGVRPGFEGGQMPLYRRLPKYGFRSRKKTSGDNKFHVINLSKLDSFEDGSQISSEMILNKSYGNHNRNQAGVKILGTGEVSKKLHLKVQAVSQAAKLKIEAKGGSVEIVKSL